VTAPPGSEFQQDSAGRGVDFFACWAGILVVGGHFESISKRHAAFSAVG
jgi:hypothetical protein